MMRTPFVMMLALVTLTFAASRIDVPCRLNHVVDPPYNQSCYSDGHYSACSWLVPLDLSFTTPRKKVCNHVLYETRCKSFAQDTCHNNYVHRTKLTCTLAAKDACTVIDVDHEEYNRAIPAIATVVILMAFVVVSCSTYLFCTCYRRFKKV